MIKELGGKKGDFLVKTKTLPIFKLKALMIDN